MNGREYLNYQLQVKGATNSQIKSKVIDLMLEVLADTQNYIIEDAIKQTLIEARRNAKNAEVEALRTQELSNNAYMKYINKYRNRDAEIEK